MSLLNDFIRYVQIDTQSSEESETTPSTLKQLELAKVLVSGLKELGLNPSLDEYGRVYCFIEGNDKYDAIGLCAHMDTATECDGACKPQVIKNYDLSDIKLGDSGLILSKDEFKVLNNLKGKTLITTDGTTLLGADDKAGIAIIMSTIKEVLSLDKSNRHPMGILFTPDEEVGRGPEHFNKEKWGVKYGFTIDGASPNLIEIENFNAASALVEVIGKSIHPGDAKGIMVNAALVLAEFISYLPKDMIPGKTELREGFNHLCGFEGSVEHSAAMYIIRNHDKDILEKQIKDFEIAKELTLKNNPGAIINLKFDHQYRNMYEVIKDNPEAQIAIEGAYKRLGLEYSYNPIRGGTDGATFSFMGIPTPNLGTGSYNHHGRYEFAVLEQMELMVKILKELYTIR